MKHTRLKRPRLIITESENQLTTRPTSQARGELYRLIAQFRKDAEQAEDERARLMFALAIEIMAGLARAFQHYETDTFESHNQGPS